MSTFINLSCVTDLIGINNPCDGSQPLVEFWFDDNGISLNTAAKIADEKYITGQNLITGKIRIALDDVMAHLTRNVTDDCDLDVTNGVICTNYATRIARAVWYRATALIYKELTINSMRYNEVVHYAKDNALSSMVYYDSSFYAFTNIKREDQTSGQYQLELERLEPVRAAIEQICCAECVGSRWSIVLP